MYHLNPLLEISLETYYQAIYNKALKLANNDPELAKKMAQEYVWNRKHDFTKNQNWSRIVKPEYRDLYFHSPKEWDSIVSPNIDVFAKETKRSKHPGFGKFSGKILIDIDNKLDDGLHDELLRKKPSIEKPTEVIKDKVSNSKLKKYINKKNALIAGGSLAALGTGGYLIKKWHDKHKDKKDNEE